MLHNKKYTHMLTYTNTRYKQWCTDSKIYNNILIRHLVNRQLLAEKYVPICTHNNYIIIIIETSGTETFLKRILGLVKSKCLVMTKPTFINLMQRFSIVIQRGNCFCV